MIPEALLLVEEICSGASKVDDLRAPVSVLLQSGTFEAVKGVADPFATANDTFILIVSKGTFVAYSNKCCWTYIAVANRAFTVAFVAETPDGYPRLFSAHD